MTLAVGTSSGFAAVLVTDSLAIRVMEDGSMRPARISEGKLIVLPRAGLAVVVCGQSAKLTDFRGTAFQANARRVFDQYRKQRAKLPAAALEGWQTPDGQPVTAEEAERQLGRHGLLVADVHTPGQIGLLTDDGETWRGRVLVEGAAKDWWLTQPEPKMPRNVTDCTGLALTIAQSFKQAVYTERDVAYDMGLSAVREAPILGPFQVCTVTREGARRWTFPKTSLRRSA